MPRWALLSACILPGLSFLGLSCAHSKEDKMEALRESVEGYHRAFRWKAYERASLYVPNDLRAAFVATYSDDENMLDIEGYQVLRVTFDHEEAAKVAVRVRFMRLPSATLETRIMTQHWHRVGGAWILEHEDKPIIPLREDLIPEDDAFGGGGPTRDEGS